MKLIFRLFIFLLFINSHFLMSQDFSIQKKIKEIDSLIQCDNFENAQKKTTYLYNLLRDSNQKNKYKPQLLELQFRQAVIYDEIEDLPVESLKILLNIIDEAEARNLHSLAFRTYLMIALAYEKSDNLFLTDKYLDKAFLKYKNYNLEEQYSTYCIRRSSYYRFVKKIDSLYYFAQEAEKYAERYNNEKDLLDSYLLMGVYAAKNKNYTKTLEYDLKILKYKKKHHQYYEMSVIYNNVSVDYLRIKNYTKALMYNDSAYAFYKKNKSIFYDSMPETRSKIYEGLGKTDSAYYYFKQYHNDKLNTLAQAEKISLKKLEEQYQNDRKEATIKEKDNQMIFIGSLLAVIVIGSILLYRKNRQISNRNKIINHQLGELTELLKQKQYLLSELQHRVKNNLQHVISILEIQKESADFNNIEELIRGNQNRIHSMALLHKKLNLSDNVNDIDFIRYINDLSEIVKESYNNHDKEIRLNIYCTIETIIIGKALPIGFIIVELISNSMKHAFKNRNIGIINIEITKDVNGYNKFYYSDNGDGFDFNKTNDKGLGLEITKGLIDQIDGIVETKTNNGFELIIFFK